MKPTILLMFSLFLITRSLLGQIDKFNYIDSDIKKQFFHIIKPDSPRFSRPKLNVPKNLDSPTKNNLNRFNLYLDSSFHDSCKVRHYSDFVVAEKYPGSSRFYAKMPSLNLNTYGKSFIIKPDSSAKYYLIIKDPIPHTIIK